ncbi:MULTISPECIES: ribonuclease H family protein [unclassified Robiginitalea]|uniref:ribonuclease H family protein n=1 Tax=Robiginitalea TaxID=252306 RepID=UPI00234BB8C2|nr:MULTISPECIES: ribonuclease H family protein [unclassified Robiginitalea]MDC6353060.1 ribonuclease H family protein [Robiginitalea sp. PM2]MDC6373773.1 ribonuclease H family protein [Robiginitalea sp. SP8]
MAEKNKFYVVWKGKKPGVYTSWEACKKQIQGEKGAQYMGFPSRGQAEMAYRAGYREAVARKKRAKGVSPEQLARVGRPNLNSISVDAASSGNPGVMEYQGVDTRTGKRLFHQGPFRQGTNNIGEFLAIVHALAYLKKQGSNRIIYSDSRTAMSWVRKKKCNTKLEETETNRDLFDMVRRAVHWLETNSYETPVVKWETRAWGEIPADFGRK